MNMDHEKILRRIQKCLRLAESSEPHEAAAALRQAKALMEKYGINEAQASFADIGEARAKASGKKTVPAWEGNLANEVARMLGCRVLFQHGELKDVARVRRRGHDSHFRRIYGSGALVFVGAGASPEIARYAFDVLRRKLRSARAAYKAGGHEAASLDAFCYGWVVAVQGKIKDLAPPQGTLERVDAALVERHPRMANAAMRDASGVSKGDRRFLFSAVRGLEAGKDVDLHRGMGVEARAQLPDVR